MDSSAADGATSSRTSTAQPPPEPQLSTGHREPLGPNPKVGAALAVLVGIAVLWFLYRIRRAFGMK